MPPNTLLHSFNFPERALRNLGTFNTSYMDQSAQEVFFNYANVNAIDNHAYPELELIKAKCAEFLLNLLNAQPHQNFRYFTTSGSSESVLLAMLVLKKKHQQSNLHRIYQPNIIIGENCHISWYKAARYLGIALRVAPINPMSLMMDNVQVTALINPDTIGICGTLGAPTTLLCDDILDLNHKLTQHFESTDHFIPIHVDAASGGFVIPFIYPNFEFNFCLKHVFSINISSHKYGLVYPSLGWLFMRNTPCLEELLDESKYLGASIKHFSMQFSHSASHIMTQYYYIQTLGTTGYQFIMTQLFGYAEQLKSAFIKTLKDTEFVGDNSTTLPGLIFSIKNIDMVALSKYLKEKNWYLPVYTLPKSIPKPQVARIVMRYGYDDALIAELTSNIAEYPHYA